MEITTDIVIFVMVFVIGVVCGVYIMTQIDNKRERELINQLLELESINDLSDNCQYWIGEIFYNRKEYKNALDAFYKVFEFEDNNKEYYAQYKIALCYLSLDDIPNALKEFQNMIDNHPTDSDLVKKSKRLIDKYSNN